MADSATALTISQTQRLPPQGAATLIIPQGVGKQLGLKIMPVRPGDEGYLARIPPPANDFLHEQAAGAATLEVVTGALMPASEQKRLTVSFSRKPGMVILGIEVAPDWDLETTVTVSIAAFKEMYAVLEKLVKIKDNTGGEVFEEDA